MQENKNAGTDKFEAYLKTHPFRGEPRNLYEAMNYIMQLGGKRLRPRLLLMSYEAMKGHVDEDAMQLALAVETFHNFSLVHDDIMDHAPMRRGKVTVHERWGEETAILAGDNLLIRCYDLILGTGFSQKETLLLDFTRMATEVCEGQQMDMNMPLQEVIDEQVYLDMIRLKTAVLPACSLKLGAVAAGAAVGQAMDFYQFGLNLGMAFQLQDDFLDCFGSSEETGKQEGGDIIENKKTLLYLHALKHLGAGELKELQELYRATAEAPFQKVQRVRELFVKAGSDRYLLDLKTGYEQQALLYLDKACREGQSRDSLMQLFEFLKTRKV